MIVVTRTEVLTQAIIALSAQDALNIVHDGVAQDMSIGNGNVRIQKIEVSRRDSVELELVKTAMENLGTTIVPIQTGALNDPSASLYYVQVYLHEEHEFHAVDRIGPALVKDAPATGWQEIEKLIDKEPEGNGSAESPAAEESLPLPKITDPNDA